MMSFDVDEPYVRCENNFCILHGRVFVMISVVSQ